MAFRQPTHRPQTSRQLSFHEPDPAEHLQLQPVSSAQRKRSLDESEEWVLFSPTAPSIAKTHTTSTERTPRTLQQSRLSDFGSLDTAAQSTSEHINDDDNVTQHGSEPDDEAELDSLDDGLHAFHESSDISSPRQRMVLDVSGTVLPTHDGLGTFGDSSAAIHQQLWQFERAHRRKQRRRTSSVQRTLDELDRFDELSQESERIRRIEQWRLEQSRALLDEIERETRRMRRMSRASAASRPRPESLAPQTKSETNFSSTGFNTPVAEMAQPAFRQPAPEQPVMQEEPQTEEETTSWWQRFAERVIRDLIGIDETILSIILGEDLPTECQQQPQPASLSPEEATPRQKDIAHAVSLEDRDADIPIEQTWQHRLLVRIARELGILVHQLSEHPGAFSTYLRTQEAPSYAGFPGTLTPIATMSSSGELNSSGFAPQQSATSPTGIFFQPTAQLHQVQSEASLWGIEEETPEELLAASRRANLTSAATLQAEREYWEQELDVKMVFDFLKNRFSSPSPDDLAGSASHATAAHPQAPASAATERRPSASTLHSARRAALIRQHHPLAAAARQNATASSARRRALPPTGPAAGPATASTTAAAAAAALRQRLLARTASSSCASQSKRSSSGAGAGAGAGGAGGGTAASSRNFWDLGGSGSLVGSASGQVGVWGEA